MKTIQLAIRNSDYAQSVRNLLLRDGAHRVYLVDRPDLAQEGLVVIDEDQFQNLAQQDPEPERFVIITRKATEDLSRVWDAGIRHVVFEEDPPLTTQLAIIAAEMRLGRDPAVLAENRCGANFAAPGDLGSRRCGKCGRKNANSDSRGIRQ
jgi:hypothetical protein